VSCTRLIRSLDELESLGAAWTALLKRSSCDNIFLTHEWMSSWARAYLTEGQLFTLVVCEEDQPVALAPLWIQTHKVGPFVSHRELKFLGTGDVCSDYLDIIAQTRNRETCVNALWNELVGTHGHEWDVFEYAHVRHDSRVLTEIHRLSQTDDRLLKMELGELDVCPFCALPAQADELQASWSASRRYTVGYSHKHLSKLGELRFHHCSDAGEIETELTRLRELNTRVWTARGEAGSFASTAFQAFHSQFAKRALQEERLFLCSLWAGDQHLGTFYGFLYAGVMYYYIMSVVPSDQKRVNTGDVLLSHCMQHAVTCGCREFDFLRGGEAYKYRWTDEEHRLISMRIYRRSARALGVILAEHVLRNVRTVGKFMLGPRRKNSKSELVSRQG
jgi:CelD/BcsL family acetyltransferase involved in cellulose biosynthesis